MDSFYLSAIVEQIKPEVEGRTVAGISVLNSDLLFDLRLDGKRRLLASLNPAAPALYLSARYRRKQAKPRASDFLSLIRGRIIGAKLVSLNKRPLDRVVEIQFARTTADGRTSSDRLMLELTGRSANAVLVDADGSIIGSVFDRPARLTMGAGEREVARLDEQVCRSVSEQEILDRVFSGASVFGPQHKREFLARCDDSPPVSAFNSLVDDLQQSRGAGLIYSRFPLSEIGQQIINPKTELLLSHIELVQARGLIRNQFSTLSEAADVYYPIREQASRLRGEYEALIQELRRAINKRETVIKAIETDRARFGQPNTLRRFGELILANLANARLRNNRATVVDYYDAAQREIQIEIPDGLGLEEAASEYFARYRKARRALEAIASREREVSRELEALLELNRELEAAPTAQRLESVRERARAVLGKPVLAPRVKRTSNRKQVGARVGRWFLSSDGYEIGVGRNDRENDQITFRIARAHDVWLHASDYPGSHVIVRNPNRQKIVPHRTIVEAAELAALYSQAKREGKVAIHYTLKKFVSKPPRAKPGLVRLSSFKTILAEPRCDLEKFE